MAYFDDGQRVLSAKSRFTDDGQRELSAKSRLTEDTQRVPSAKSRMTLTPTDFEQFSLFPMSRNPSRLSDNVSRISSANTVNMTTRKLRKKNMPRPYSPIYTNVNYYSVTSK